MKRFSESFEQDELMNYLRESIVKEEVPITEGKLSELFSKAYNYLKGKIAQIGNYFVALWNDEVLPAIIPVTAQKAWMTGEIKNTNAIHILGNSEDKKFCNTSRVAEDIISSRQSTLDILKQQASRGIKFENQTHLLNQNLINEDGYDSIEKRLNYNNPDFAKLNLDARQLSAWIRMTLKNVKTAVPLLIWGAPGVGKTQIINAILKEVKGANARLEDLQLSRMDYDDFFLPGYKDINGTTKAVDIPKSWLPVYEPTGDVEKDKAASEACGSGLLFLDELTRTRPQVQAILLKLVDERKVGPYRLGDNWSIIAASNRIEDDPTQDQISTALLNRFMHVNFSPAFKTWKTWAKTKKYMNQDIIDWLECNQSLMYGKPTEAEGDDANASYLFASPRTWERVCITLANFAGTGLEEGFDIDSLPDEVIGQVVASGVGSQIADKFLDFLKLKRSIDIDSLKKVWTDSDKVDTPKKQGRTFRQDLVWIITSQIVSLRSSKQPTPEEFIQFCKYLARLDASAMNKALKDLFRIHVKMNLEIDPESNGVYYPGIEILIKAYPEFDKLDWEEMSAEAKKAAEYYNKHNL